MSETDRQRYLVDFRLVGRQTGVCIERFTDATSGARLESPPTIRSPFFELQLVAKILKLLAGIISVSIHYCSSIGDLFASSWVLLSNNWIAFLGCCSWRLWNSHYWHPHRCWTLKPLGGTIICHCFYYCGDYLNLTIPSKMPWLWRHPYLLPQHATRWFDHSLHSAFNASGRC